jgi:hypothetical protein
VSPETRTRTHPAIKALVAIAALAALGYLIVRSAQDTRAEPYEIAAAHLASWTLGLDAADDPAGSAISLRPPPELPLNLFRQLFRRQMESLSTPLAPGISLALSGEVGPGVSGAELMAMAAEAGLATAKPSPRCVGYRRIAAAGVTRQLYFVWFVLPEFDRFRQLLAPRASAVYRVDGLSPVMLMAAEPGFLGWQPVVADEAQDCQAPVSVR